MSSLYGKRTTFGGRVKALRQRSGGSQKDLAEASLLTQATISRIEAGKVKSLKPESMRLLALALGVSVDYLKGDVEISTPVDLLRSDPAAVTLMEGYRDLSHEGKRQLIAYVRFLLDWEKEMVDKELEELETEQQAQKKSDFDQAMAEHREGRLKFPPAIEAEDEK